MKNKIKLGKKVTAILITVLVFAVIMGLHFLGVFRFLENKSYDMRVRFWTDRNFFTVDLTGSFKRASDDIFLITLDDDSIAWAQEERGWGWPWPRQAYAEMVEYFSMAGVYSIAFDILYPEPSVYRKIMQNDDASFANASKEAGNVIQAVMFSSESGTADRWPSGNNLPLFQPEGFGSFLERFNEGNKGKLGAHGAPLILGLFPIPELIESAGALGSATGIPDSDGIYRRLKPFTLFDGKAVPGLSAASLLVSGMEPQITYNEKKGFVQWEHISIPVNKDGFALLRFRGELNEYRPISAWIILQSLEEIKNGEEPLQDPMDFIDSYVFMGVYGQGFFDIFPTPISSTYPGVGAHVTMLDNMLKGDFIRESSNLFNLILLLIVVAAIVSLTIFSQRIIISLLGSLAVTAAIIISAFAAYQFGNLWLPMITYFMGALLSFITVTLYNYMTEGSQKRFIKSAFSQYLSPVVVNELIKDPSKLELGGEKREMTAIFTDVRGFSTFSEALGDPAKLVELLNFYLTKMSNIVLDYQGTIDKYEGDAIIAFFGAPIHYPDHASLACRAVIGMKKAEPEINREAIETGLVTPKIIEAMYKKGLTKGLDDPCQIFTRIGMNTGDMVVGNMGTPNKMNYTIMGNAVNLAARLEGVNKQYNTGGILISEYTRDNLKTTGHLDEFIVRPLSRVRVVGINTPLRLYELLDTAADATPALLEMVKNWTQAFDLYEQRDFKNAGDMFQSIFAKDPADMAAKKYLDRCVKYSAAPPDDKTWDNGVDNLSEK